MNRFSSLFASVVAMASGVAVLFAAGPARADIFSDCGGAVFKGSEKCTVEASCDVACQPPNLQLACDAQLEASCAGGCNATLPSCQGNCEGGCTGKCSANPGTFDCKTDCQTTCEGNCTGECASGAATCTDQCNASCAGRCNTQCSGTPPMAGCQGQCDLSCQGSCSGQANLNCDINCQAMGSVNCTAMLGPICTAACNNHTGIFCDGNFINATDANACVDDLKQIFQIEVTGYASASSGCDGGTCQAQAAAGGSVSCSAAPVNEEPLGAPLILGFGVAVGGAAFRRQRRARR